MNRFLKKRLSFNSSRFRCYLGTYTIKIRIEIKKRKNEKRVTPFTKSGKSSFLFQYAQQLIRYG